MGKIVKAAQMSEKKSVYNPEADKRWRQKNPERARYLTDRTSARRFIRSKAELEDLEELEEMIKVRRKELINEQ
jgi:hypothetical protein